MSFGRIRTAILGKTPNDPLDDTVCRGLRVFLRCIIRRRSSMFVFAFELRQARVLRAHSRPPILHTPSSSCTLEQYRPSSRSVGHHSSITSSRELNINQQPVHSPRLAVLASSADCQTQPSCRTPHASAGMPLLRMDRLGYKHFRVATHQDYQATTNGGRPGC